MDNDLFSPSLRSNDSLVISSFRLGKNGVTPIGTPTYNQWESCLDFVQKSEQAVHFWLGDLLNYGESVYGESYTQAIEATGFEYGTLANDKSVASKVAPDTRRSELSFEHHKVVAKLSVADQEKWLGKAVDEQMTVRELKRELSGKTETELEKKEALVQLEIAAKRYCEMNSMDRADMAIILASEEGESIIEGGKLVKVDEEIKSRLKFLFGK